jgi:hypothetical protein
MRSSMLGGFAAMLFLATDAAVVAGESPAWRYVVPGMGEPFDHPPLRVLALSDQRPDDLREEVAYRGKKQRYAQLRYGSPNSVRVALVLDEIAPGEIDLYADTHRKRLIGPEDKVAGDRLTWQMRLDVAVVTGDALKLIPRTVLFRYGRATRALSYATCGYVEGQTKIGERMVMVRRVDGDGNGFLTDPQDRLWLDLDGQGRWDPIRHQFPFSPLLTLGRERYVVKSDALGKRLHFAKLEGTGTVRLAVPAPLRDAVEELFVTLSSRDGIVATLEGKSAEAVLPVGDYRFTTLLLNMKDAKSGETWGYLFSDNGADREEWHTLAKDATLVLDPIGQIKLTSVASEDGKCTAGEQLQFRPGLYTGDGLLITMACFGGYVSSVSFGNSPRAKILLAGADGAQYDATSSGFA